MSVIDPTTKATEFPSEAGLTQSAQPQSPHMDEKVKSSVAVAPPLKEIMKGEMKPGIDNVLLKKQLEQIKREFQCKYTSLNFSVDESTQSLIVRVLDSSSGSIIRQIPPDEILALRRRLQAEAGILFDDTV